MDPQTRTELRDLLAEFYPDSEIARVVVEDAGLDARRIKFDARSIVNWSAILGEVEKTNQLDQLLEVVHRSPYGQNPRFQAIYQAYQTGTPAPDAAEPPAAPPSEQSDIFLSYSRRDATIMSRLRADLRCAGFTVWTDDTGLEPGTPNWQRAIQTARFKARSVWWSSSRPMPSSRIGLRQRSHMPRIADSPSSPYLPGALNTMQFRSV